MRPSVSGPVPSIANRPLPKSHPRNRPSGATPRGKRPQIPGWAWAIAGLGIGILLTSAVKMSSAPKADAKPIDKKEIVEEKIEKPSKTEKTIEKASADKPSETKSATKFDFYTLLPEQEVIEPNERPAAQPAKADKSAQKPQQQTAVENEAAPGEEFILQAGSFRSAAEADKRRAQVQTLGLPSRQESVSAGGDTWYRVLVGPFPTRDAVTQARDKLAGQSIDTILVRKKTAG